MSRVQQIVQNGFIRILAVFSVLFRSIFGFLGNIFGSLGKSFGFSDSSSGYYVESDRKEAMEETKIPVETVKNPQPIFNGDRRRPKKSNMADFMKMAKEMKQG